MQFKHKIPKKITFHCFDGEEHKKTIHIKSAHIFMAAALVCATLAGGAYSFIHTKIELNNTTALNAQLEEEKQAMETHYTEELDSLKAKATEIEAKVDALTESKDEIYEKIDHVTTPVITITTLSEEETANQDTASGTEQTTFEETAEESPQSETENSLSEADGTETPDPSSTENASDINTDSLTDADEAAVTETSLQDAFVSLNQVFTLLSSRINYNEITYVNIAADVTEALAYVDAIPSGWPVQGEISSTFSYREDPITTDTDFHTGIDIRTPAGTPVLATASGMVVASQMHETYGNMVVIDHGNGFETLFAHNQELVVSVGDKVEKGDIIAYSGATGRATGNHVHYEVRYGSTVNIKTPWII